uniref:Sialic acid synthase n=1 Tax=Lygus hesperus TaxID=30085 RepID=A0A0A9YZ86_LYGHE
MASILFGNRSVGDDQPCFVIAEIGQNHQGDINTAKRLIDVAKECGADCVKFQKSCLREKFTKNALESPYESPHSWGSSYGEHKSFLELSEDEYKELQSYSQRKNILFTASAMDPVS